MARVDVSNAKVMLSDFSWSRPRIITYKLLRRPKPQSLRYYKTCKQRILTILIISHTTARVRWLVDVAKVTDREFGSPSSGEARRGECPPPKSELGLAIKTTPRSEMTGSYVSIW